MNYGNDFNSEYNAFDLRENNLYKIKLTVPVVKLNSELVIVDEL